MSGFDPKAHGIFSALSTEMFEQWRLAMQSTLEMFAKECESPIEQQMLVALSFIELPFYSDGLEEPYSRPHLTFGKDAMDDLSTAGRQEICLLQVQPKALEYRLDFCLLTRFESSQEIMRIAVECDGHQFHERTKEQAKRDRKRDRDLQMAGFKVFRFTGSEIFRDARKCATEVEDLLKELARRVLL